MFRWSCLILTAAVATACESMSRDVDTSPSKPMTDEEMMKKMTELGTPGPGQKKLEPLIGSFKVTAHMWNEPGGPETVSEGTNVNEWIFDGRYVKSKFEGTMMGGPFTGSGLSGFDNFSGKYQAFWIDSMSTGMMPIATGTVDASGKVFTYSRTYVDPLSGKSFKTREVMTIVDADHHVFEWYQPGPDGKEFKMMRFEYARAK